MKNKSAILLAAITLAAFAACADPLAGDLGLYCPEDHFLFRTIDNGTAVEITGYVGGRTDVRIPPFIGGLPVTVIGAGAFAGEDWWYFCYVDENTVWNFVTGHQITSVNIPGSVTHIRHAAFIANRLSSVSIPSEVVYIDGSAFAGNQLVSVYIPDNVIHVGRGAFADNQLASVTIPDSVTHIQQEAFARNNLINIIIPSGVTHIEMWAFINNQLTYVIIPDSVTHVRWDAFDDGVTIIRSTN